MSGNSFELNLDSFETYRDGRIDLKATVELTRADDKFYNINDAIKIKFKDMLVYGSSSKMNTLSFPDKFYFIGF